MNQGLELPTVQQQRRNFHIIDVLHLYNIVHEAEVVRLSAEGMSIKSGNEVKCRPAELPPIEVTFIFCFFQRIPASQLLKGLLGRWAGVCL